MNTVRKKLNLCTEQTLPLFDLNRHGDTIHKLNTSLLVIFGINIYIYIYWMSLWIALDAS